MLKLFGLILTNTGLLSKPNPITYIIYILPVHLYAFNETVAMVAGSLQSTYTRSPTEWMAWSRVGKLLLVFKSRFVNIESCPSQTSMISWPQ